MKPYDSKYDSWGRGPKRLLLVGPPGTGKTRTALEDFMLPALQECLPERVLACSFSNAAAGELRERLSVSLRVSASGLRQTASTIHSEALRVVRASADDLRLYDAARDAVKSFKRDDVPDADERGNVTQAAIQAWDMARALLVHDDEEQVFRLCAKFASRKRELARDVMARIEYIENRKREEDAIDFTDMLLRALDRPARQLDLLLVDEAQDMTPLQWALIDHWGQYARRVTIIGDALQCIHEWMGASYQQFKRHAVEWDTRVLSQSWRVPVAAFAAANSIVSRMQDAVHGDYLPTETPGEAVWVGGMDSVVQEAQDVAREYADAPERIVNGELVPEKTREMFILCRTNRQVISVRKRLNAAAVPYCAEAPGETRSFAPATARRAEILIRLYDGEAVEGGPLRAALDKVPAKPHFAPNRKAALASLKDSERYALRDLPGLGINLGESASEMIGTITKGKPAYWTELARAHGSWILTAPAPIRVMTWHRSKGREADVVAVCAERDGVAAMGGAVDDAELRAMYVATTRTKDKLIVYGRGYNELARAVEAADVDAVPF